MQATEPLVREAQPDDEARSRLLPKPKPVGQGQEKGGQTAPDVPRQQPLDHLLALPRPLAEGDHQGQGAGRVAQDVGFEGRLAHPGDLAIGDRLRAVAMAPAGLQRRLAEDAVFVHQRQGRLFVGPVRLVHPDLSFEQEAQVTVGVTAGVQELPGGVVSSGHGDARFLQPPHHEGRLAFVPGDV